MTENRQQMLLAGFAALSAFLAGACVMILELSAGRLVSRYLGQSLYTWTAIIGVVFAGLSGGNILGGKLADRPLARQLLPRSFAVSALLCAAAVPLNCWIGEWPLWTGLSWPLRIFCHVSLVLAIPSLALGVISPLLMKAAISQCRYRARTFGLVFACGCAGSLAGTFLAGFVLPVHFGVKTVICGTAAILLGLSFPWRARLPAPLSAGATMNPDPDEETGAPAHRISVSFYAFAAGFAMMLMEIVAGRMLSREFGQSLYSWTTVIGVILAGMSAGAYAGGRLAERLSPRRLLPVLFLISSILCMIVPRASDMVADWSVLWPLRWPVRIFWHAVFAFLPAAVAMGMLMPAAARAAMTGKGGLGSAVGRLYAWNGIGGIIGTFAAGFALIALVGTRVTVYCGALALALAAFAARPRPLPAIWALTCALLAAAALSRSPTLYRPLRLLGLADKEHPLVVYKAESPYYCVTVRRDGYRPELMHLFLDRLKHSSVNLRDPLDLQYQYELIYAAVVHSLAPTGRPVRALALGGGGYSFQRYFALTRPESRIDVVEIDPAVTRTAPSTPPSSRVTNGQMT